MTQTNDDYTYDMLNFDGLERRGNYRTIAYREDVLHALDRKDPAAIIYQIVYRWQTEYKKPEVLKKIEERKKAGLKPYTPQEIEDMMYVFMSYNDFVRETGGAVGYNTVIRMLDYLVNTKKVLKQRENHNPKYPDFEYSVNKDAMRQLLKALPIEPVFAPKIPKKKNKSTQMGTPDNSSDNSTQMGTQSTQTGIASTQMGTEVYPNGGTSHNYSHTTNNNHTEESKSVVANASERDTPSPSFADDELAMAVDYLNANGYQVKFEGQIPGNDLLFWVKTPNGKEYFDTPENIIASMRTIQQRQQDANTVEANLSPSSSAESTQEETAERNRFPNNVTPLTEKNVNADESLSGIERETAVRPSSSLVVDSPKDTLIHENMPSATNSYSPQSTADSQTIAPTGTPKGDEAPAQTGKGAGKGKGSGSKKKQKVDLDKIKPLPRPERPSDEMPWNAKKLLAWGDYFRGHTLPFSERANSRYQWAEQAAIALIERNVEEKHFLAVMRFMRGVNLKLEEDPDFRDDWWPTHQSADLWNAEKHFDDMLNKARQTLKNRKQNTQARAGVASTMMTPQTRQPQNVLEAPKDWIEKRAAGGK